MQNVFLLLLLVMSVLCYCGNTLYPIAANARGSAMGGSEIAVPNTSIGLITNPANITTIHSHSIYSNSGFAFLDLDVDSPTAGEVSSETDYTLLGSFAYAYRLEEHPISFGIGFYPVVGTSARFSDFDLGGSLVGTLEVEFGLIKVSPTVSYHITPFLSVGVSFELGYSIFNSDTFSEIAAIGGNTVESSTFGYGGKFGIYYQFAENMSLGFVYTMKMPLRFEGEFEENGNEEDAVILGFNTPHVFELGFACAPTSRWLVAIDIAYYMWDEALNVIKIRRDSADGSVNPNPLRSPQNWDDQISVSFGMEYKITDSHSVRCGYNYGNNPVPAENLTPTLTAITEHHFTVGYGYRSGNFQFDVSYEHHLENTVTSRNAAFNGTEISSTANGFYFTVTYHFGKITPQEAEEALELTWVQ